MSDFSALTAAILAFRDERDWQQFHSLRNLITSLNLLAAAARDKLAKNALKYPVDKAYGSRAKYTALG